MAVTGLVFLAAYLTGCVLALARHPIYGLATYIAVFYLHPPSRWWGHALPNPGWAFVAAIVTLLAVVVHRKGASLLSVLRHSVVIGLIAFVAWMLFQMPWVMDRTLQFDLIVLYAKYILLACITYACLDSDRNIRIFLWAHVLGCFYLGWLVFSEYTGGRFEYFGGPGIGDSNTAGLQLVTGAMAAGALFLSGKKKEWLALVAVAPFIVNGVITTISRSAFLATVVGGLIFNVFAPLKMRGAVRVLSILGAVLFLMLTNETYWERISSLKYRGAEVEGVDTGTSRLVIIDAQLKMFESHPAGCGHRCTALLSPFYLDDIWLTGPPGERGRSSHNTFLTMLVEHGIPGAALYLALLAWLAKNLVVLAQRVRRFESFDAALFPAVASVLIAITLGDLFVDYLKLEVRIWFIVLLIVLLDRTKMANVDRSRTIAALKEDRAHRKNSQRDNYSRRRTAPPQK